MNIHNKHVTRKLEKSHTLPPIEYIHSTLPHTLTYTAIFCLPGKEIKQRREWLSHETKAHPENHVTCNPPLDPFDLLDDICERNERDLEHHASKSYANNVVCGDADEQFVQDARKEEDEDLGQRGRHTAADKR